MVLFFLQRFFKKKQKKDEERDRAKAKENMLILKSIDAVGKLTYADAVAIRDGKTNGEMKEAMKAYAEVNDLRIFARTKFQEIRRGDKWNSI